MKRLLSLCFIALALSSLGVSVPFQAFNPADFGTNNFNVTINAAKWATLAAAKAQIPTNQITVSPVGIAQGFPSNNLAAFGPDTPGTTTSGINEALHTLPTATNVHTNRGGGKVTLLSGVYSNWSTVMIPQTQPFVLDLGGGAITWRYLGPTNAGAIACEATNEYIDTNTLWLDLHGITFETISNGPQVIVDIAQQNFLHVYDCKFTWYSNVVHDVSGSTWNVHEQTVPTTPCGLVGLKIHRASAMNVRVERCIFWGLGNGLYYGASRGIVENCHFIDCGVYSPAGTPLYNVSSWTNSDKFSLGSAIVYDGDGEDWFINNEFITCGAVAYLYGSYQNGVPIFQFNRHFNGGYRFVIPTVNDGVIEPPIWIGDVSQTAPDSLATNNGSYFHPSGKVPSTAPLSMIYGTGNNANSINLSGGDMTLINGQFNGRAMGLTNFDSVLSAPIAQNTNVISVVGAGTNPANGIYVFAGTTNISGDTVKYWTNMFAPSPTYTGAHPWAIVYDALQNFVDVWNILEDQNWTEFSGGTGVYYNTNNVLPLTSPARWFISPGAASVLSKVNPPPTTTFLNGIADSKDLAVFKNVFVNNSELFGNLYVGKTTLGSNATAGLIVSSNIWPFGANFVVLGPNGCGEWMSNWTLWRICTNSALGVCYTNHAGGL